MRNAPAPFSPVVVAPTYNNARTLADIVRRLAKLGLPIIVVNDGSTDGTDAILHQLEGAHGNLTVVAHRRNRGKAAALAGGFAAALARGHTHAVTIDTDGQLDPEDVPAMLDAARSSPAALVLGTRDDTADDYPARSRAGRRGSNLFVRLESGLRVSDSQCGLRVYPLRLVRSLACSAGHFGFETEILTRAGWAGYEVVEVPVSCRYLPPGERVSHFRPWLDTARAVRMHARLMARAMAPWPHRVHNLAGDQRPAWRRTIDWLNPVRAWRDLRQQPAAPQELATGVAVGVFIGNMPVFGIQTLLSLYAARRLHLNPLPVVVGSHISTPPVGPLLIAIAIGVGHWLLHGQWMQLPAWQHSWSGWARLAGTLMIEWSLGALLVGTILAAAAFFVSNVVLRYASPVGMSADRE